MRSGLVRDRLMVQAPPKCHEHELALQLIRVEISEDKVVTDVFGCPHPGCNLEHRSQPGRSVESGKM